MRLLTGPTVDLTADLAALVKRATKAIDADGCAVFDGIEVRFDSAGFAVALAEGGAVAGWSGADDGVRRVLAEAIFRALRVRP